jgi:ribosomal protein S18 acetylase RimI-like enzyme
MPHSATDITIRPATLDDLDYLVTVNLKDEGYTPDPEAHELTPAERAAHREKIRAFTTGLADVAWLAVDLASGVRLGMIMARFRDRHNEARNEANEFLFRHLGEDWLPPDGRFCEIYNLWVHPSWRRQGLATRLKLHVENEARARGLTLIYTHTETRNAHVLELNRRLGYQEIRRGPLWDAVERVSLIKRL